MEWPPLRICVLLVVLSLSILAESRHCDHRHYWDSDNRVCRPCAKCPMNEIIRKPCGRLTDTVCGPFREFNYFNQFDSLDPTYTSYEYESLFGENSSGRDHTRDYPRTNSGRQNEPIVEKDDGEYWKNLAFALIGVVCVLIFVATIIVLLACRKLHETSAVKRPEEEDDDDSGYVVIRAIRPPNMVCRPAPPPTTDFTPSPAAVALLAPEQTSSGDLTSGSGQLTQKQELRMNWTYKPKRRLLNYDADDVFESEDSSGSRTSRKAPLQPIPERSISDSENVNASEEVPA